jgi:Fungal Zn(2)-Cys(6) binuclear cluster domain
MDTATMPQSTVHGSLCPSSIPNEPGNRLPSLRQLLLLPQSFSLSSLSSPSSQTEPEQNRSLPENPTCFLSNVFSSIQERTSEPEVRALRSDHPTKTSGVNARIPVYRQGTHFMHASSQERCRRTLLPEPLLSSGSSQYILAQDSPSGCASPGNSYDYDSLRPESISRQHPLTHGMACNFQVPVLASPWYYAPSHPNWGTTKAGRPRKRLAEACLNCRHKKIRCHLTPYSAKCTQCERTNTDCRFESGSVDNNEFSLQKG